MTMRVRAITMATKSPIRSNPPPPSSSEQQSFPMKFTEKKELSSQQSLKLSLLNQFLLINKETNINCVDVNTSPQRRAPYDNGRLYKSLILSSLCCVNLWFFSMSSAYQWPISYLFIYLEKGKRHKKEKHFVS